MNSQLLLGLCICTLCEPKPCCCAMQAERQDSQSQRLSQQMRKCVLMTEVRWRTQAWCPCAVLVLQ